MSTTLDQTQCERCNYEFEITACPVICPNCGSQKDCDNKGPLGKPANRVRKVEVNQSKFTPAQTPQQPDVMCLATNYFYITDLDDEQRSFIKRWLSVNRLTTYFFRNGHDIEVVMPVHDSDVFARFLRDNSFC
jgi:hypothetical protein